MLDSGMSYSQIRARCDISPATISAIRKSEKFDPERVNRIKEGLATKLYTKVDLALDSITEDKLKMASAQQAMMTAAIGIDKARLIEGQVTSRLEFVNASDKELAGQIADLSAQLERLQSGQIIDADISINQPDSLVTEDLGLPPTQEAKVPDLNESINQPDSSVTQE